MSQREEDDFDLIEEAYRYKVNGNYPQECTAYQKRSIRRKASQMIMRDGEIFLTRRHKGRASVCFACIYHGIRIQVKNK